MSKQKNLEMDDIECEFSVQHLQYDDYAQGLICEISKLRKRVAEIAELKDEVDNLNDELMFRPKYSKLTEQITELRKAIQAIDDIVYEECDAEWIKQIWSIVEGVKEVE